MVLQFQSANEAATERLGRALADVVSSGTVIGLNGPLGAGKTRLVQAIATGLGVPADVVTSPTFVLINEYPHGRLPIYHFDAYRLRDVDEFRELGPDEYFYGDGVCLVEWAERVAEVLPAERFDVQIDIGGASERVFQFEARGEAAAKMLAKLTTRIN